MAQTLTARDYTIGIICALPLERTAVTAMLDGEEHPEIDLRDDDENAYTFGTIAGHNVVIASLGTGSYGTVSAKEVSMDIKRSFPHLRFGLMVGIAGGVPRPRTRDGDVRLGDIVVGCAQGVPSIVAYDQGKENGEEFDIRSELADPPSILAKAVARLQSNHDRKGPTYLEHLSQMLTANDHFNNILLIDTYYNKPPLEDELYEEGKIRPRTQRHLRPPSGKVAEEKFVVMSNEGTAHYPKVFIGSIGSGDTVMKNAAARDRIYKRVLDQRKAKLLCFEMEAAGIVRGWPCLVIRGICDYCDGEKNDAWQRFAAATAAAYAKDLLKSIKPTAVEQSKTIDDAMKEQTNVNQTFNTSIAHNNAGAINTNSSSGVQNNYNQSGSNNKQFNAANMNWR